VETPKYNALLFLPSSTFIEHEHSRFVVIRSDAQLIILKQKTLFRLISSLEYLYFCSAQRCHPDTRTPLAMPGAVDRFTLAASSTPSLIYFVVLYLSILSSTTKIGKSARAGCRICAALSVSLQLRASTLSARPWPQLMLMRVVSKLLLLLDLLDHFPIANFHTV